MQRYEYNLELQTQYYKIYYFFVFLHFAFSIRVKKRIFAFRKIKPSKMNRTNESIFYYSDVRLQL